MTFEKNNVDNQRIVAKKELITPKVLKEQMPLSRRAKEVVLSGRKLIEQVLNGDNAPFLALVGPCSIHDKDAAYEYAERLQSLQKELHVLRLIMRVYFEKPRTTVGWKGLVTYPHLDETMDMNKGLILAREIMLIINEMGMPVGTEFLSPLVAQYISDLVSWGAIGARTTESQTHREMASGLSMPVGFKNSTGGSIEVALHAMESAAHSHHFVGPDDENKNCQIETAGNPYGHLILRGGANGSNSFEHNFDEEHVTLAMRAMIARSLRPRIMVDCSHANSDKKHANQPAVLKDVVRQRVQGNTALIGFMLESNLQSGNQPIVPKDGKSLEYGKSVTDECIGWEETEQILREADTMLYRSR